MIIDIKIVTIEQKSQLAALAKLYFKEIEDETLDDEHAYAYITNIEKQLEKYPALHFLVSEENNKVNGFLLGNTVYHYNSEDCSFILELYVSKVNRLQGIGRNLVNEFEKLCKKTIYLTSSKDAEKFYSTLGYFTTNIVDEDNGNMVFKKTRN